VIPWPLADGSVRFAAVLGRRGSKPMTTLTVDLAPPVDGLALAPDARAAIDTAPKHTEDIDFRRVTCTPEIA
jgi:hypothetical protein